MAGRYFRTVVPRATRLRGQGSLSAAEKLPEAAVCHGSCRTDHPLRLRPEARVTHAPARSGRSAEQFFRNLAQIGTGVEGVVRAQLQDPSPRSRFAAVKGARKAAAVHQRQEAPQREDRKLAQEDATNTKAKAHRFAAERAKRCIQPDRAKPVSEQQMVRLIIGDEMSKMREAIEFDCCLRCTPAAELADKDERIDVRAPQRPCARNGCISILKTHQAKTLRC